MRTKLIAVMLLSLVSASPAAAGVFTDDFSRCLITKTTDDDRTVFTKWMVSILTSDPQLKPLTTLTDAARSKLAADAAKAFERLALDACHDQAVAAAKQEGEQSFFQAFSALGGSTVRQMMSAPAAQAELDKLGSNMDEAKWKAFAAEAGIQIKEK